MNDTADLLRETASLQGPALICTVVLLLLSLGLLPKADRKKLRPPLLLLLGHIVLAVSAFSIRHGPPSREVIFASVVLLFSALGRVGFLLVVDWLFGRRLHKPLPKIFRDIIQALVFLGVAIIALHELGFELNSLLTTSAILTAALGLSLQEALGNVFAGLALQAERPFEIGDWVQFNESSSLTGRVLEINWRATKICTYTGNEIIVPNGVIARSSIQNYSRPEPFSTATVSFQAPYEVTPHDVERAVLGCVEHLRGVAVHPPPRLWTMAFADSGITYELVYSITEFSSRRAIESEIRNRIWYALARAGISMPYPIRDLRIARASQPPLALTLAWTKKQSAALLGQVEFLGFLPDNVRERLADIANPERFGRGEPIVVQGHAGSDLFVVASGEVAVVSTNSSGESVQLAALGPGNLFGEMSLLTGSRGATVKATVESIVLRISFDVFRRVIEDVPGLTETLLAQLSQRQERLLVRSEDKRESEESLEVRLAFFSRIRRLFTGS